VKVFRIKTVGPTTNRKRTSTTASTMFTFESHWMPRCIPETADRTNATVMNAMIPMAHPFESAGTASVRKFRPPVI
jgi:hypothetical protein